MSNAALSPPANSNTTLIAQALAGGQRRHTVDDEYLMVPNVRRHRRHGPCGEARRVG
jgi:hypothetical protein